MDKIVFILLLLISSLTNGQALKGRVVDESNQPLPFVSIRISGTQSGTQTDLSGDYILPINGKSDVIFYCVGFQEYTITTDGGIHNVTLLQKSVMVKEIEVSAKKIRYSENTLLMDKKESSGIESSIGSSEMTKKGISNAEDGLKKVTGITFNNGRLNTRGLDDRYNQVTLNGIPLPSNNSDKKNIDLNLLPTGLIDNIKVRKTYSSDQWSNVAGAQIDISSTDITDKRFITLRGLYNTYTPRINGGMSFLNSKQYKNFGILFNFNLNYDNQNIDGKLNLLSKQGDYLLKYNYKENQSTITPTGLFVISYNKTNFDFQNSFLYVGQNVNTYRETFGDHFDYQKQIFTTRIIPTNNTLYTNQLRGRYGKNKWEIETILSLSKIKSGENNREQFVYLYDGNYQFNNIDKLDNHVFSNQNNDDRLGGNISIKHKGKNLSHKWGYSFLNSNNYFNYQQRYFDLGQVNDQNPNIDPNNPYSFITPTNHNEYTINDPASQVNGDMSIHGLYYINQIRLKKVDVDLGVRLEKVYQKIDYRDQLIPILQRSEVLDNNEILPFTSIKYIINNKKQIKFSSSITTIRPRFREMVPFIYTEVFAGTKIQGNPKLINSTIYSNDISYEIYPKSGEVLAFTLYTKTIKNPIERVNIATASGRLETFQNSEQANIFGGEIEIKKQYNKIKIDYNLSILYSQIQISDNSQSSVVNTNTKRQLQGSSPIISNMDIFYDISDKDIIGITYNYTGRKLNSVGIFGLGDIYQSPQHTLNFIYNKKINKYNLSFRINNILNTPFVLTQNTDKGNLITQKFKLGQDISILLRYVW